MKNAMKTILIVAGKRILFPPYDEIEVTGKYKIDCEDYWVTEDMEDPFLKDGSMREVANGDYVMDESDYEIPVLNIYSDASYSHLYEWKQYRNNVKFLESENENYENLYYEGAGHMGLCDLSLASPILAGMLDQAKSEVEPRELLKRLNADCLDFLQRL